MVVEALDKPCLDCSKSTASKLLLNQQEQKLEKWKINEAIIHPKVTLP